MPLLKWRLSAAVQLSDPGGGGESFKEGTSSSQQVAASLCWECFKKNTQAGSNKEPAVFCQGLTTCSNPPTPPTACRPDNPPPPQTLAAAAAASSSSSPSCALCVT